MFKDVTGTSWSFFEDAVEDPAIYTFTFDVTEECLKEPLTTTDEIDGKLVAFEWSKEKRFNRIDEEEWDPEPTLILPDGSTKRLDSNDLAFGDFVSEQAFMKEFLENPDKYEAEPENEDWKDKEVTIEHEYLGGKLLLPLWVLIAIAAVILLTSIFLIYICCAAARNRRARRNAEIQLELELERA